MGDLFQETKRKQRKAEAKTTYAAYVRYGYTMKEIADHLGCPYATISRIIRQEEQGSNV